MTRREEPEKRKAPTTTTAATSTMVKLMIAVAACLALLVMTPFRDRTYHGYTDIVDFEPRLYTVQAVQSMAKSSTLETAMSLVKNAAQGAGTPALSLEEIKAVIDANHVTELRGAILTVTDAQWEKNKNKEEKNKNKNKNKNKKNKKDKKDTEDKMIANFARNDHPLGKCAIRGSAGEHGLGACAAACERERYISATTSRKSACYMLCSIATAPCEPLSRGKLEKYVRMLQKRLAASGVAFKAKFDVLSSSFWVRGKSAVHAPWVAVQTLAGTIDSPVMFVWGLLFALAVYVGYVEVKCSFWLAHVLELESKEKAAEELLTTTRGSLLAQIRKNLRQKKCFRKLDNNAAWGMYHDSLRDDQD